MDYRILGPLEVSDDEGDIALGGQKQRALLAMLLIRTNEVVSTDRLIEALWGDEPPANDLNALQVTVSGLRKALGRGRSGLPGQALVTKSPGYVLRVGPDELDLDRFERVAEQGRDALRRGDPERASDRLRESLSLWRGEALAEFAFEEFARAEIERLEELRLAATEDRIEADLGCGRHRALVGELEALVAEHPLRERLRAQLMLALYRSGRQADALATFQVARTALAEELGIDPGPELRALEKGILEQDPQINWHAPESETDPVTGVAEEPTRPGPESSTTRPEPIAEPGSSPAQMVPIEERKVVTVLFCDLVGFTLRSDEADPEDVRAQLRPYHDLVRSEIERFGGTVEKFIGDAMMAIYGAPVTHEDDPERAVRSALRIVEGIEGMNDERPELGLAVRIGITTGEALVVLGARPELGEAMVAGDVVNTASRLQVVAPEGGILVVEPTYRATEAAIEYEELPPVELRGKARPVPIWRVRQARSRFSGDAERPSTTFVGREHELALLQTAFRRATAEPSVQLVTIVGEPGIGKSRLVAELSGFVEAWPDLVRWRQGRCLPYGEAITFWALGEIVKAEAGILETDPPEVAASRIDEMVPDQHPDAPWLRQRLRPLIGIEAPEAGREENFTAWRVFLEQLAEERPTTLIFEDLHWADEGFLAFVEHLTEYAEGVPLLMVATARPELLDKAPSWATAVRNVSRIELAPLTKAETDKLITNLREDIVLPAEVHDKVLELAGGNPLYAEEFVRLLEDRKVLPTGDGTAIDAGADIRVPASVQGLIAARLDTLPPERKRLLQDASVIGRVFWSGAIAGMGGGDRREVERSLHDLSRRELVRPVRRSSIEGETEHRFYHALVRDVCYAQIPKVTRAERHLAAASWIEETADERIVDHAQILASHYVTALELSAAGSPAAEQARTNAIRYLVLSGDKTIGIDAETAERHYAHAVALLSDDDPDRPMVLARHGGTLVMRGRPLEAASAYEEAIETFRARGDRVALAEAMLDYGDVLEARLDPRMDELTIQALSLLEAAGPSPSLARALGEIAAEALGYLGDAPRAVTLAGRAISLAQELELEDPARAIGFRGAARCFLGDVDGMDELRRGLDLAIAQGRGRDAASLYAWVGNTSLLLSGPRAMLGIYDELLDFAGARGIIEWIQASMAARAGCLELLGLWDDAIAQARQLVVDPDDSSDLFSLLLVRHVLLRVQLLRGAGDVPPASARWIIESAREWGQGAMQALVYPTAALALVDGGDARAAIELVRELERTPHIKETFCFPLYLPETVRIAIAAGEVDLARRLASDLGPPLPLRGCALVAAEALLREASGELDNATALFADAAAQWNRLEIPWEEAQALLGLGRCLVALTRQIEAKGPLAEARKIFTSLKAAPTVAETDGLLDAISSA